MTKCCRKFESARTNVHADDRIGQSSTSSTDVNTARVEELLWENRWGTIRRLPSEKFTILSVKNWDNAKAVHAGYQHVWQNVKNIDLSRFLLYIFNGLYKKKGTSSYNLQWQEIIQVCTISLLKQNKLVCRGDTSPIDSPRAPPPSQKIKLSQPAGRYDFCFWDAKKGIPFAFIYSDTTIRARTCCDTLRLREAVRKNRPDLSRGVIRQH